MATGECREGGGCWAQTIGVQYPQAGRPASAWIEPADGVFRDRVGHLPSLAHPLPLKG